MAEGYRDSYYSTDTQKEKALARKKALIHIFLFVLTFITTTLAGMQWTTGRFGPYQLESLLLGLPYSISILFILACHEFGHYFAAKYHKVEATLPYFIPFTLPPFLAGLFLNFGTIGAVIRTKAAIPNNKAMFDIGVAGPIAGFVASLIVLIYGFTHLPGVNYILTIHPEYFTSTLETGGQALAFGDTLLFSLLRNILTTPGQFVPPMTEIYHYPYLCVGWFGLFVTAMNMIPVGQLDGGHIIYSMFGQAKHNIIAKFSLALLIVFGFLGIIDEVAQWRSGAGWPGWLVWGLILLLVIKVKHPPVLEYYPLNKKRMLIGFISIFILLLSFSPAPFAFK